MSNAVRIPIYISSDCRLELDGTTLVHDDGTTEFQNAGTCTYQIKTTGGVLVTDGDAFTAEGALNYHTGSNGRYIVIIDKTITALLTRNQNYDILVAFGQDGNEATFLLECKATYQ